MEKALIKVKTDEKKKRKIFSKFIELLNKKWLKKGLTTLILILIILSIYVIPKIILDLDNVNLREIDFTEKKINSLSDETKIRVGNVKNEVNIIVINMSQHNMYEFAKKYTQINRKIKVENVTDLEQRTDLTTKYADYLNYTTNLIIVKSGEKEKLISEYELFTVDYSSYEEIDLREEVITNAIIEVTIEEKPKVYFMKNHIKYDISNYSVLLSLIEHEANEVNELDLLTVDSIPVDCRCLILTTLREDITESDRDKIKAYIEKGGEILLLCGPNFLDIELNNFQSILDLYGVTIPSGIVIEEDTSKRIYSIAPSIISEINPNSSLMSKLTMKMNICLISAGKIIINEEKKDELGVTYEELATTSEKAFLRSNIYINSENRTLEDQDAANSILGAFVIKKISDNNESKLIVFSNDIFATNQQIIEGDYLIDKCNNKDILLNSVAFLTEREDIITIRKQTETVAYTVTQQQHIIIMIIIFGLPILIILIGIVVWIIRRRKK